MFTRPITYQLTEAVRGYTFTYNNLYSEYFNNQRLHTLINERSNCHTTLKKTSLDPNQLKNYRHVSSLPFTSKVIEKIVAVRLSHHMQSHNLYETKKTAYRKGHLVMLGAARLELSFRYS